MFATEELFRMHLNCVVYFWKSHMGRQWKIKMGSENSTNETKIFAFWTFGRLIDKISMYKVSSLSIFGHISYIRRDLCGDFAKLQIRTECKDVTIEKQYGKGTKPLPAEHIILFGKRMLRIN
jgi:hypothetical protein